MMVSEVNTRGRGNTDGGQAADPRLYLRDEELDRGVGLILEGERALLGAVKEALAASDLPAGEWQILLAIFFRPGRDVSALRQRLGMTVPTFARLLGRLDARGLVDKGRSGSDGRRRVLSLTEPGTERVAPVVDTLRSRLREAYRAAGPEAVSGASRVLDALVNDEDTA
ncbi:MAG: MarR family winged helix-turn-helix transcriptional regulator [Pseudomonadota bacterium]